MCSEVVNFLDPQKDGIYVDATFGQGGYSRKILLKSDCRLIGIDRDKESEQFALSVKKTFNNRFFYILTTHPVRYPKNWDGISLAIIMFYDVIHLLF